MLGHKISISKLKKSEIISSIFSDHNAMRLEINSKKNPAKNTNKWRLNNMLLKNQWITEEIKEDDDLKPMGHSKISSKRDVYSDTNISQETRKISNKQPNLTSKGTRERRKNKTES